MGRFEWDDKDKLWDLGPLGGAQGPKLINPHFKGMKLPPREKKVDKERRKLEKKFGLESKKDA